jgi:membrane protease YdiL (CAAX protease family)
MLLAIAVTRGVVLMLPRPPGQAVQALTLQMLAYGLWFGALWMMLKARYGRPFWPSLGWMVPWPGVRWSLVLGPALALTIAALGAAIGTPQVDNPVQKLMSDRFSATLVGVFAIILGPLAEELVFRGFVLPLAIRSLSPAVGIAAVNVPFALLHGPQYEWTWQHMVLLFLASSVFGWVRWKTGSTAAATLVHGGYNGTFFVAMLLQRDFYG